MSEKIHASLRVIGALLICCCSICLGAERFNFNSHVGIVDNDREGRLCLAIPNSRFTAGTEVIFVLPHKPQRVARAVISRKSASSCSSSGIRENNWSFYWLKLVKQQSVDLSMPMSPAIAVVRPARPILVKRGTASGDLDGDGRAEFFRTCTYSDEIFLTVWSGKPLLGKRRWHSYYYLSYEAVPTCTKRDYR
jgi:hypothetical protein